MIVRYLPMIEAGDIHPVRQNNEESTYAPMLRKEMGEIDWTLPAAVIERRMRGMLPWPGAYTTLDGHVLKIWKAEAVEKEADPGKSGQQSMPGMVSAVDKKTIYVTAGEGTLALLEVQAEGKKRMGTDAFLRGNAVVAGKVLGN